jgi:glutathione S-transferase
MTENTATPTLKLSYFDFHGGRGEPARLALSMAGIPFDDDRVDFKRWGTFKPQTPFGQMPVLEVDGKVLSQSNTINRFVGRLTGLYPQDAWQAAKCDEVCDALEALSGEMSASFRMKDQDQLRAERERLVAGPITAALRALDRLLVAAGGEWFADGRLTMADLKSALNVRHLLSGKLDHVPVDLCERIAPALLAHSQRVFAHPGVKAYYDRVLVK